MVTLVRDPIARNLSSYFEHLDSIWRTAGAHRVVPFDELCAGFLERYTHREPLTWFDDELRPVLGLDVYAQPFPAKGSLIVASDTFDALVLKAEAPDTEKQRALAAYLGVAVAPIRPANRTAGTVKGLAYSRFVREVRLPATYVDSMLDAWYTRHFFSDAERETMREKYLPNGDAKN